jgi:hypothetical protein
MDAWNHDISKAPRGVLRIVPAGKTGTRKVMVPTEIIAASACGVVCVTRWLDDAKRWDLFTREAGPIAWMPYAGPRTYVDDKGKTRYAVDLPAHPTMAESWFAKLLREQRGLVAA